MFYFGYMSIIFEDNFKFHELKLPKVNMLMGDTRRCVCLTNGYVMIDMIIMN
jgi:hypothetical protein